MTDRSATPGEPSPTPAPTPSALPDARPNGAGAAAILAAGVGSLALGIFAMAGDSLPALQPDLSVWRPTGPLSGVTAGAVLVWLLAWAVLRRRWSGREVDLRPVNLAAFAMLFAGLLLTFPPIMDALQGR